MGRGERGWEVVGWVRGRCGQGFEGFQGGNGHRGARNSRPETLRLGKVVVSAGQQLGPRLWRWVPVCLVPVGGWVFLGNFERASGS